MVQLAKEKDLNHLSFLRELSVLEEGLKSDTPPFETRKKSPDQSFSQPLKKKLSFLNIPFKPIFSGSVKEKILSEIKAQEKNTTTQEDLSLANQRKPIQIQYKQHQKTTIPVIKKEIISSHQIIDSKTLVVYASSWVKTIFDDKVLFKAIPATGTNLLILPKGRFYFVQFMYQKTPIHPTQEMIQEKLFPLHVLVFHDFKSFRDWIYQEMRPLVH